MIMHGHVCQFLEIECILEVFLTNSANNEKLKSPHQDMHSIITSKFSYIILAINFNSHCKQTLKVDRQAHRNFILLV